MLSVPACVVAALATSIPMLIGGRLLGGVAAGVAYPTTLALITALWSGSKRTKAIALWSGLGGAMTALGPVSGGWLLFVAALVLAINFSSVPGKGATAVGLGVITLAAGVGFFVRQRRAKVPLSDLEIAVVATRSSPGTSSACSGSSPCSGSGTRGSPTGP